MLPTQKPPPKPNLHDLSVLVYGPHKCGKSEFCSQADSALFLATEPGLNHLEVFQQPISTWDELLVAARDIAEGKHAFRTVIIDTVDNAYRMCAEYICQRNKIEHESDLEYGKGYSLVNSEFHRVLNKLALLPYGLFLVSHSQERDIETRTGKYTKVVPTLPDKARKLVLGLVDIILFCDLEPTTGPDGKPVYRRVLRTKPSAAYEAGDRTRRLPEVIDLNFPAFVAAFAQGAPGAAATAVQASGPTTSTAAATTTAALSRPATTTAGATTAAPASSPETSTAAATTSSPASSPATTSTTSTTSPPPASSPASRATTAMSPAPAKPANSPATATARPRAAAATNPTSAMSSSRASSAASSPSTTAASKPRTTSTANR